MEIAHIDLNSGSIPTRISSIAEDTKPKFRGKGYYRKYLFPSDQSKMSKTLEKSSSLGQDSIFTF